MGRTWSSVWFSGLASSVPNFYFSSWRTGVKASSQGVWWRLLGTAGCLHPWQALIPGASVLRIPFDPPVALFSLFFAPPFFLHQYFAFSPPLRHLLAVSVFVCSPPAPPPFLNLSFHLSFLPSPCSPLTPALTVSHKRTLLSIPEDSLHPTPFLIAPPPVPRI